MERRVLTLASATAVALLGFDGDAGASLLNLHLDHHATVTAGGAVRDVYRVYAEFTQPIDRVNSWGAGGNLGSGGICNILSNGSLGSGFYNNDVNPPPCPNWETHGTIGVAWGC